tara:strand:+ start:178 stop:495 length:318 start_codon:yes stop_codon:yes gene_type:complete
MTDYAMMKELDKAFVAYMNAGAEDNAGWDCVPVVIEDPSIAILDWVSNTSHLTTTRSGMELRLVGLFIASLVFKAMRAETEPLLESADALSKAGDKLVEVLNLPN